MIALLLCWTLQDEAPLPKIAEITSASGTVEVVDRKGGVRRPAKFGTRWRNAEVRDEDRIRTGAGAQAEILFPDATRFTVKEKSEVQILQKELPKPTPEGNTVGRRIRVLFGELVGDVIPNREIRNDFEFPAGSAAVRGTRLAIRSGGASTVVETTDGLVRFFNVKYDVTLDVAAGQSARFTEGSLILEGVDDGGGALAGHAGGRAIALTRGDRLVVTDRGATVHGSVDAGPIGLDGGEFSGEFDAAKTGGAAAEEGGFDPLAPTGAPASETPGGDAPAPSVEDQVYGDAPLIEDAAALATSMQAEELLAVSLFPQIIDDFNRPDDTFMGLWIEEGEDWSILNGRALVSIPPMGGVAKMAIDIGNLTNFDIQATFNHSTISIETFLAVNAAGGVFPSGCEVAFNPVGNQLNLFHDGAFVGSGATSGFVGGADYILQLQCDGSTLTATMLGSMTGSASGAVPG